MLIKYIGHSCFKIRDEETGYSIVFDPYKNGSVDGYRDIADAASEVLCSHEHDDHHGTECIKLEPQDDSPYEVTQIESYHDPEHGKLRGPMKIYVITDKKTGEKLVHYGDVGENVDELLSDENLALLKDASVALVPVGGVYTYDKDQAVELIERTTPKLVIPMHYRSEELGFDFPHIDTIENFAKAATDRGHRVCVSQLCYVETTDVDPHCEILAVKPQNI